MIFPERYAAIFLGIIAGSSLLALIWWALR